MSDAGRPSKLTLDVQERIVQALMLGNYRKQAAAYAGVDEATLRRWMGRGRNAEDEPYASFRSVVLEAEAKANVTAMGCITKAVHDGDWKAAAWLLERRLPEQYAPRSRLFDPYRVLEILDEAGMVVDRSRALTALAQAEGSLDQQSVDDVDDLDALDLTEEQRDAIFAALHASRTKATVIEAQP